MNDDFKYIAAIAEHRSISKAAHAMHISQPALSQRLKRLETKLGTELFERTTASLRPTAAGEIVVRYARRAVAAENSMRREVYSMLNHQRRRLRIGISMARANALLTQPIIEFYESFHDCTVELRQVATLEQLHELFLRSEIDFALFTPIAPDPEFYDLEVLCRERLVVVASANLDSPQLQQSAGDSISIRQLEGVPFVLPTCGIYFDPIISHLIDDSRTQLDIVMRDCEAELALSLVENGLGVAIVPSTYIIGRPSLQTFELSDIDAGNVLRYIRRHDVPCPIEEERFMNIVRSWLDDQSRI